MLYRDLIFPDEAFTFIEKNNGSIDVLDLWEDENGAGADGYTNFDSLLGKGVYGLTLSFELGFIESGNEVRHNVVIAPARAASNYTATFLAIGGGEVRTDCTNTGLTNATDISALSVTITLTMLNEEGEDLLRSNEAGGPGKPVTRDDLIREYSKSFSRTIQLPQF